jgi:signal peptidase I
MMVSNRKVKRIAWDAATLGVTLAVLYLVYRFIIGIYVVPSASMEPTFDIGDRIVASKLSEPHRGDTVVFTPPKDWGVQMTGGNFISESTFLKRIAAEGGDHLVVEADGTVFVNDVKQVEPYINQASSTPIDLVVPEGSFFMLGDNRGNSADSRAHMDVNNGIVPREAVVGVVVATVWPLNHIGFP